MNEFIKDDPFRVVTWRWERAGAIAAGTSKLSRRRDDEWIRRAAAYRAERKKAKTSSEQTKLLQLYSDIHYAFEVYTKRDDQGKQATPFMIEARLLIPQTYEEISPIVGIAPRILEAYAKLFFDVEDRLQAKDYIYQAVIGPKINKGTVKASDFDVFWKLVAYRGGVHMLDAVHDILPDNRPGAPDLVWSTIEAEGNERTIYQGWRGSLAAKADENNLVAHSFMDLSRQYQQDRASRGATAASSAASGNVGAMLEGIAFYVGAKAQAGRGNPAIRSFDASAVELRGDELVRAALGYELPDAGVLGALKYPEKVNKEANPAELPATP